MEFAKVSNVTGFFKDETGGKWVSKVKQMYDNIKILFKLNTLFLEIAKSAEIYKYIVTTQDSRKIPVGWIMYYPNDRYLEIYDEYNNLIFTFKGRQTISKGVGIMLEMAGANKLFTRLTNLL